jgi:hypothetical protein
MPEIADVDTVCFLGGRTKMFKYALPFEGLKLISDVSYN